MMGKPSPIIAQRNERIRKAAMAGVPAEDIAEAEGISLDVVYYAGRGYFRNMRNGPPKRDIRQMYAKVSDEYVRYKVRR